MEIASLILGIISLIISIIPVIGMFCYIPAIVGLILGIVALATMKSRGKTKKAKPIIGIVTSGISMVLAIIVTIVFTIVGTSLYYEKNKNIFNQIYDDINNSIYNEVYNELEDKLSNSINDDYYYDSLDNIKEYKIGDKIKSEYCDVVINKIENFSGNYVLEADSGKELIMITVTITNTDDTDTYISKYDFEINDGTTYDYPEYDSTRKYATFENLFLEKGESTTGTLCFQKEKNNDNYYIVYNNEAKIKVN